MAKKEVDIKAEVLALIHREYGTQTGAAIAWGYSPAYVSAFLTGKKTMPAHIAAEAGYEKQIKWVKVKA